MAALTASRHNVQRVAPTEFCTPQDTDDFTSALNKASNGCISTTVYDWDGSKNPTNTQYNEICNCFSIRDFQIPTCLLRKESREVPLAQHYDWIMRSKCPKVTAAENTSSQANATATDKPLCTEEQMSTFSKNLKTASTCLSSTTYEWGGKANPTQAQYSEICQCTGVTTFAIPPCFVVKGSPSKTVELSRHYTRSKTTRLVVGIASGALVVLLILGLILWKRVRKTKQRNNTSHDLLSPPDRERLGSKSASTTSTSSQDITDAPARSPASTPSTSSTTSGNSTNLQASKWDDPVILAVRIPYDSIFFGSLISRGGFGEVYRGTCRGETVAIKNLLPERRKDFAQIDNFLSEVKLMSTLEHERIVKFIGVAWNSLSDACMVVEFMENGDLRSVLGRWDAPGPEQRATGFDADKVKIALHVAHALVYLHSLQPVVVHRDLKSKNVLLDANLDAKLTDFGISRERADSTMTGGVGSSLWMAPEVMMGARYDEKADIFSFGVVLSELDTHQLPYAHARTFETGQKLPDAAILQQVMLGRISVGFSDRADPDLVQLGRECVSLDPNDRPTTAQVLHRLHQVLRQFK